MQYANIRSVVYMLGLLAMLLGGCGRSTTTRFFILTSSPTPTSHNQISSNQLVIGIGPVELPEYLNRPQIVSRTNGSWLKLAEFDKWAEPLEKNFTRVLTENLSGLLATERIVYYTWKGSDPVDFRIALEIIRFDGTPAGEASLIARWSLFGSDGKELTAPKRTSIAVSSRQEGYEGVACAMSEAVAKLSLEIAATIRKHR